MNPAQFCAAVRQTIERRQMDALPPGPTLVAVSGGADSLALLHALHRLGWPLEVAHFDHRARHGSERDSALVERHAADLGLTFHGGAREEPHRRGRSPEESMRDARLAFLERTAARTGATRIATGHTLDDQAETVLMRLVTGAGRRGLGGIPPVRAPYIRPLIDRTREETHAFCDALGLKAAKDPTNEDTAYVRNAIRHDLLPYIASRYNTRASAALARSADVLRDEDELLDALAAQAVDLDAAGGAVRIEASALASLHPALQRRVIRRALPLDAEQTERVRALALGGDTGDELSLPQRLNARLEYGWLVLGPAPSSPVRPAAVPLEVPGTTELLGWAARVRATIVSSRPDPFPDGGSACAVDAAKAGVRLTVRTPKPGDRFRPYGMRTSKKLGDYFTDAKVPRAQRALTPVIATEDEIVWVVGHRVDDRCKVTAATRRVLVLEWEEGEQ